MKQLHVVHSVAQSFGGLGLAALRYSESLARRGDEVVLFVVNRDDDEFDYNSMSPNFTVEGLQRSRYFGSFIDPLKKIFKLYRMMRNQNFDVVHTHGLWSPFLAFVGFFARCFHIPFILSPHGCLEPWAIKFRGFKKRIALALYQRQIINNASLLVATSGQEARSIRGLKFINPVAIIPNGVDFEKSNDHLSKDPIRNVLFLSRIHPIKGLENLITAWKKVRRSGWSLTIAGPDEGGYTQKLRSLVHSEGLDNEVEFLGLVTGENKSRLYDKSDIFVFPTFSENFGIVVAEALAHGLPVITTTGAPWQDLVSFDCGWWVEPTPEAISEALDSAMLLSRPALAEMGKRGVRLIHEKYSWDRVGNLALAASRWAVTKTDAPEFVEFP